MQNKFTPDISKSLQHENKHEVKTKIDNLPGQNWVKEIRELSSEFSLDAQKIITNVKHFLADAIDGETLKKEFEENKDHYQKYYTKLQNETFNEAKEITEALIAYVSKVKENTQTKLTHLLISNPGIEIKMPVFMKNVLGEEAPVTQETPIVEETKESIDQDQKFIDEITEILHKNISEEEMASAIKEVYPTIYGKNMVLKIFYKKLGLTEKKDIQARTGIEPKIVELLILIKKNPEDAKAKAELERKLHPAFTTEGEKEIKKPGVTVVSKIDLQEKDQNRFKKIAHHQEVKQAPTTDPLELVGEKMALDVFLGACGMDYETIAKHIGKEVPARYFSHNRNYTGPLSQKFDMHFLTIGQENKPNGDTPLINVSILVPKGTILNESEIYKVKLEPLGPRNIHSSGQTRPIRGKLIEDVAIPEAVPGKSLLGNHPQFQKLLEEKKFLSN